MATVGGERVEGLRVVYDGGAISELWARVGLVVTMDDGAEVTVGREVNVWGDLTAAQKQALAAVAAAILAEH